MTIQDADLSELRSEMEAFIHIIEALAQCNSHGHVMINPEAVQRLARVLNQHIVQAIAKLYGL